MKAVLYTNPREFSIAEVPKPACGPNQVLIKVMACGICKTDLHIHDGSFISKFPLINGHEFAGVVAEVGTNVTQWRAGDRVTADNTELCGHCPACRENKPLYCRNFDSHGCNMPGGFAEYVCINHDKVFAIPDGMSFAQASFAEPTACAVHGVDRIRPALGDSCLLFGAGPTGIILAQLLRLAGVCRFVIADPNQAKLDILRRLGFAELVLIDRQDASVHEKAIKALEPGGFDIVVDATGAAAVTEACFNYAKMGAKIVVYGVCDEDARISVSPYEIFSREYQLIGSFAQTHCFGRALAYLASGKVVVEELISHRLPLSEYGKGLELILAKKAHKVIIEPHAEQGEQL